LSGNRNFAAPIVNQLKSSYNSATESDVKELLEVEPSTENVVSVLSKLLEEEDEPRKASFVVSDVLRGCIIAIRLRKPAG
jgi:hypothetical protein